MDQWGEFLDPIGNCRIERRPDMAIFHVPGGVPYDLIPGRPGGMNAPRLLADTEGDFVIQVRVHPFAKSKAGTATTGADTGSWRSAGLVVQSGDGTVVRLERVSWGERNQGAPMAHCESWKGSSRDNDYYFSLTDDERSTLLQIERRGSEFFCRYSDDGSRWETEQMTSLTLTDRVQVGLYAVNTTPSELDPAFEDLRFQSSAAPLMAAPTAELAPGPWVSLFNGQDLTGWIESDGVGGWQVGDGILVGRGAYSYLVSERTDFRDFHLRAEVRINHGGNSGIYFRSELLADWRSRGCIGYEADINNTDPGGKTGSLRRYPQSEVLQQIDDELIPPDQWFTYEVIAVGNRISTLVNGKLAANVTDNTHLQGRLALQLLHEDRTVVEFRKIEIRNATSPPPIGEFVPLFNGRNLAGWKTHPDASGAWTVTDNMLVGRGANQYLYTTRGDYDDFRLRAEVKINAAGDSGILVRMPAPESAPVAESGYEVQIVGDPAHAFPTASIIPHGTAVRAEGVQGRGGLIQPDQWFVMEILAIGGKLTVAIDGREVIRYRDDPPRPRGNIALQSFSDATEVVFRKIEIAELAAAGSSSKQAPAYLSGSSADILTSDVWEWTEPENLGQGVNSDKSEGGPTLSGDGLTLVFHSDRDGGTGDKDLWITTRDSPVDSWAKPINLGPAVNSDVNDSDATLSADGLTLLFNSNRSGGLGQMDLWMSTRADKSARWTPAIHLGTIVNSPHGELAPALSADGLTLVFNSDRDGKLGSTDLWMSTRSSGAAPWSPALNLGPRINSPAYQGFAALASDGLSLIYNSNRSGGPWSGPLWLCTRPTADAQWSQPKQLWNDARGAWSACLAADHSTLLFDSKRAGGLGEFDLWMSRRVKRDKPLR